MTATSPSESVRIANAMLAAEAAEAKALPQPTLVAPVPKPPISEALQRSLCINLAQSRTAAEFQTAWAFTLGLWDRIPKPMQVELRSMRERMGAGLGVPA